MLLDSFQRLSADKRKAYYEEVVELLSPAKLSAYPNIKNEVNEGNEHKVGVIRRIINTKMGTNYTWDDCMAAVDENM
jgi:hypothetical protein